MKKDKNYHSSNVILRLRSMYSIVHMNHLETQVVFLYLLMEGIALISPPSPPPPLLPISWQSLIRLALHRSH
jgi:hypothetical protein